MDNFVKWLDEGEFTPHGYAYDIGRGTMSAINRYKRYHKPHKSGNIDERSNGNGSLMQIMPAVLYCIDSDLTSGDAIDIIHKVGGLTHAHIRSNIACGLYYFMASAIIGRDGSLNDRLQVGLENGFSFTGSTRPTMRIWNTTTGYGIWEALWHCQRAASAAAGISLMPLKRQSGPW